MTTKRFKRRAPLALLLIATLIGTVGHRADGHTPHDSVSYVAVSPSYAQDGKVFAIVANRLLVSTDGAYGWKPLVRGLPHPPEEGETLFRIAIAASNPAVMYVSSRAEGVFRSADGGSSWHAAAGGLEHADIQAIAVAPHSTDVVIAGGARSGLYRTADGGKHWRSVAALRRPRAIAFVPGSGRAVVGDGGGRVSISDDDGSTWHEAAHSGDGGITAVAASTEAVGSTVFAATDHGTMLRSKDGGTSFAPLPKKGLPPESIPSIVLSPNYRRDHTLWASASRSGVYRSTNGGERWIRVSKGLTTDPQAQTVHVTEFRGLAVAVDRTGSRVIFAGGFDGLFRSDDGGHQWWTVDTLADHIVGLDVSPDFAHDSTIAVASYVKGAYLSTDAGKTWNRIDNGLEVRGISEGNKFAPVKRLHNVVFSPDYARDQTIFCASWTAFLKSTNRGRSWSTIAVAPPTSQPVLRQFVIGLSPSYKSDRTIFLGTRQGDIFRSRKAGEAGSWALVGKVGSRVRSIVFDPAFPAEPVLYASTADGVVRSEDSGATWTGTGPSAESLLAISPAYGRDGTVFAGTQAGLFVSRDRGRTWSELTQAPLSTTSTVEAVAVSPSYQDDHTLLVSVGGVEGEGLYRSTDGGSSFVAVGSDLIDANRVIADFSNPTGTPIQFAPSFAHDRTIFAYAGQDVVRSSNGGDSWAVLQMPSAMDFLRAVEPSLLARYDPAVRGSALPPARDERHRGAPWMLAGLFALLMLLTIGLYLYWRRRRSGPEPTPA